MNFGKKVRKLISYKIDQTNIKNELQVVFQLTIFNLRSSNLFLIKMILSKID